VLVCLCRGVTDRTVNDAIAAGARTVHELRRQCSAGSGCGGCWPTLSALLAAQLKMTQDGPPRRDDLARLRGTA
jgi:bacterioferritin-associated ferredoxin